MIRPLRTAHRRFWGVLALALPTLVAAALVARRPPTIGESPAPSIGSTAPSSQVAGAPVADRLVRLPALEPVLAARAELVRAAGGEWQLRITPEGAVEAPDLLAYWVPGAPGEEGLLPPSALLLGPVGGPRPVSWPLPAAAARAPGTIVVVSLAHGERLAAAAVDLREGEP